VTSLSATPVFGDFLELLHIFDVNPTFIRDGRVETTYFGLTSEFPTKVVGGISFIGFKTS